MQNQQEFKVADGIKVAKQYDLTGPTQTIQD